MFFSDYDISKSFPICIYDSRHLSHSWNTFPWFLGYFPVPKSINSLISFTIEIMQIFPSFMEFSGFWVNIHYFPFNRLQVNWGFPIPQKIILVLSRDFPIINCVSELFEDFQFLAGLSQFLGNFQLVEGLSLSFDRSPISYNASRYHFLFLQAWKPLRRSCDNISSLSMQQFQIWAYVPNQSHDPAKRSWLTQFRSKVKVI